MIATLIQTTTKQKYFVLLIVIRIWRPLFEQNSLNEVQKNALF